jgi:hypothetical protein
VKAAAVRRALPSILIFLGTLLLVFGLLAWVWIGPQARQAPIDTQSRTISLGEGSYHDFEQGETVTSDQLRSVVNTESDQSVYDGDDPVGDDIAVYEQTSGLFDDGSAYEISFSGPTRIAIDRTSALPVACCEADDIAGLTVKWPFGVDQSDYPLWDSTLGDAVTATFRGEEEIDGLPVYRFEAEIPETDAGPATDDPDGPQVRYEATKVYFVEPQTGRIISSQQDVHQWLVDADTGETLLDAADVSLTVSDETVAENLELARADTRQLGLLSTLTWLAPLLGIILLVVGVLLARPLGRARDDDAEVGPRGAAGDTARIRAPGGARSRR